MLNIGPHFFSKLLVQSQIIPGGRLLNRGGPIIGSIFSIFQLSVSESTFSHTISCQRNVCLVKCHNYQPINTDLNLQSNL